MLARTYCATTYAIFRGLFYCGVFAVYEQVLYSSLAW